MFDIGFQELVLIFVIALLVFGPKNLPQLGRSLGRAMREFRRASDEFRSTIETNLKINEVDEPIRQSWEPAAHEPAPDAAAAEEPAQAPAEGGGEPASDPEAAETRAEGSGEPYLAQKGARLFHRRDCGWVKRIAEPERVYFKKVTEAREGGFAACPACEPWERE
jgi:Tat protein translocase TatB subunit